VSAVPIYPVLLALTFIVTEFLESGSPLQVANRALLLAFVVTGGLQLGFTLVGGRHRAAFFAALAFLVLFDALVAAVLIAAAAAPVLAGIARDRRIGREDWPTLTRVANVVSIAVFLLASGPGVASGAFRYYSPPDEVPSSAAGIEAPDIYLVLLDGYPRADTLLSQLGHDNGPFLESMRGLGFDVAEAAHSNYTLTPLTLASMFNAKHIDKLVPDPPSGWPGQARRFSELINEGAMLSVARQAGYEVVSLPMPTGYTTLYAADRFVDFGLMTEFELQLLDAEIIRRMLRDVQLEFVRDQHRQRILRTFDQLSKLAEEDAARPRLIFAHLLAPHPPLVFAADGSPVRIEGCLWTLCAFPSPLPTYVGEASAGQVTYLNSLVKDTVTAIVERSIRPAVIVVFSDHGSRYDASDKAEHLRSLLLTRTPGHPGMFPPDSSPINVLPRILNAYVGTGISIASEESYWIGAAGGENVFFPLEPFDPSR